jgi:hypothetical protein
VKIWPNIELHRCRSIGNGETINFWTDKWIDEHTRIIDFKENIPTTDSCWKVKDVVLPNGAWNYNMLQNVILYSLIQKLHAIVPPHEVKERMCLFGQEQVRVLSRCRRPITYLPATP